MKETHQIVEYFKKSSVYALNDIYAFRALIADFFSADEDALFEHAFFILSRDGFAYKYWNNETKRRNAKVFAKNYFENNKISDELLKHAFVTAINVWLLFFNTPATALIDAAEIKDATFFHYIKKAFGTLKKNKNNKKKKDMDLE